MADEKVIRIGGDASGFGNEINRAAKDAKEAFSDIGLDELFDEADRKFDSLQDKIHNVTEELNRKKREADDYFDRRREEGGGNEYFDRNIDKDQLDYNKRHEDALKEWERFVEKLKKALENSNPDPNNNNNNPSNSRNDDKNKEKISRVFASLGTELGSTVGRLLPGNLGSMLGRGVGSLFGGASNLFGGLGGAGTAGAAGGGGAGGAGAGAAGAGGAAAGAGAAVLPIAAIGAVVIAVAAIVKQLYGMGMEDWRMESKVNTTFDINRDSFGKGGSDFGLDNVEYKQYILDAAKSRGNATEIEDVARKQLSMIRGYGLSQQEVQSFDKFTYQDVRGKNSTDVIVDILSRSEKQGILGVSGGDFSRLPEKIEQVSSIMAFQKMSGERVDSLSAVNFMAAGSQIGGRFGDDRASEVYGRMNESIRNPSSPGMKAFIFEMMKRANPNASFTDIQAMMENGATGENLTAILPQIAKMPQGEMRRMVLQNITGGNMQDAIRLDNAGSLDAMIRMANSKGISSQEAQEKYDTAMKRTETNLAALDQLSKIIENRLTDFGEKYLYRQMNDLVRGVMEKDVQQAKSGAKGLFLAPAIGQGALLDMATFGAFRQNKVTQKATK